MTAETAETVIAALHAVSRESDAVDAYRREAFVSRAAGRSLDADSAARQLRGACHRLAATIAVLHRAVVGFDLDIAGLDVGCLAELGLRGQTLAILLALDALHGAMRGDPARFQELFTGRLGTIDDVVAFLSDALARLNRSWLCHRATSRASGAARVPAVVDATRPLLYRSAIRAAQRRMRELGADPDLVHFLRAGARSDCPEVQRACGQLTEVFTVHLTIEPDAELLAAAAALGPDALHRLAASSGAALELQGSKP